MIALPDNDYDIVGSIVLFNNLPAEVDRAISQFQAISSSSDLKTHLCIIDNSTQPLRPDRCVGKRISYHFANRNLGYGRAHNIAIRASRGRTHYNLVMNTDIIYSPRVISELKSILDSNPAAGLAAPKVCYPDGTLQHTCRLLPTPMNVFLRRFLPRSRWTIRADENYELRWWNHDSTANIPFFQGSFLLLRSNLCTTLGGFDERFFLYAEDIDLCRRIHQVAETLYVPQASITHEFRRLNRRSIRGTWLGIQSHFQYFSKWGWFFDSDRQKINSRTVQNLQRAVQRSGAPSS